MQDSLKRLELLKFKNNLNPKEKMELFRLHYEINIARNNEKSEQKIKNK